MPPRPEKPNQAKDKKRVTYAADNEIQKDIEIMKK